MDKSLAIREATPIDLPKILELYACPDCDDGNVITLLQVESIWNRIQSYPDYHLYIALAEDQIVGTFALLIMDNLGHQGSRSGILEDVVVDPRYQRQGIGTAMIRFALNLCHQKQCYKVILSSNFKRQHAHAFYESLGFEKHGYSFVAQLEE